MAFDVLAQLVLIFAHAEEIILFLDQLGFDEMIGTFTVA